MRRAALALVASVVAAAVALQARTARAGDPADAARRAREQVGEVFARPEFDPLAQADRIPVPEVPAAAKSWVRAFVAMLADALEGIMTVLGKALGGLLRWLVRGLSKLFGGMGGGGGGGPVIATWVAWLLGAVAVLLIVFLVWRLVRASRLERAARLAATTLTRASAVGDDDALAKSPEEWKRSARELAEGGARRDALRALYLALLASLHRVGAIRYDRTRTNTAYVGDLERGHAAYRPFRMLTRRFDAAWYGGHEPDAEALDAATREADDVLAAYRREAVPA